MKNQGSPLIFCHYGSSDYLEYTFRTARLFNPETRIILLGDDFNKKVALNSGVEHHKFVDFSNSEEIKIFNQIYKHIAGKDHKREFWTQFVILRWFYVHQFIKNEGIHSFWHFDSDNLILTDLKKQEHKFLNFDCTEQCSGICMNGFISSQQIVDLYVKEINRLYSDKNYLAEQANDFVIHTDWALTEMNLYNTFKNEKKINSVRLNKIINNETFDDCICQPQGYETYDKPINGKVLKKLFTDKTGTFFCYNSRLGSHIKMNSINMSWVPDYLFEYVYNTAKKSHKTNKIVLEDNRAFTVFNIYYTPHLIKNILLKTTRLKFRRKLKSYAKGHFM